MSRSKILKFCFWIIVAVFAVWRIFIFLEQNSCLDDGNVWDYQENRCREDCLVWNEINGCIKMTDEQVKLFKDCRHKEAGCISKEVFDDICLRNNMPLNKKTGECDAEFTPSQCNKLGDEWIYPDICKE